MELSIPVDRGPGRLPALRSTQAIRTPRLRTRRLPMVAAQLPLHQHRNALQGGMQVLELPHQQSLDASEIHALLLLTDRRNRG